MKAIRKRMITGSLYLLPLRVKMCWVMFCSRRRWQDDYQLFWSSQDLYINIAEKTCSKPFEIFENPEQDRETIEHIIQHFRNIQVYGN